MKNISKVFLILFLLIILIYVTNITAIPDSIVLFQGENPNLNTILGIHTKEINQNNEYAVQTSSNINNNNIQKKSIKVSLFNVIDLKEIEVNTIPKTKVVPLGNSVGLKLYTTGVLVVGTTEIQGQNPCKNSGIEKGDIIVEINQKEITCTSELINTVNKSEGKNLNIKYLRDGKEYIATITPVKTKKDEYKLGLWVRDRSSRNRNHKLL